MPRDNVTAISQAETKLLFADLKAAKALVLAVSGGPDSTALMVLAARWRKALKRGPELIAVTVDHGLRAEAKREARNVARLAEELGVAHRTVRWKGDKPTKGIPQAARVARYALLAQAARKADASHILTAHTRDDQAETVVMRLARGSGITGLAAMQRTSAVPSHDAVLLVRPFLDIPKARLIATLTKSNIAFADDPTNRDAAFTRARLRGLMPQLAAEGLDAARLALLARRAGRADAALEQVVDIVWHGLAAAGPGRSLRFEAAALARTPHEILLRLLGRAIDAAGSEGPVELGKLEALAEALVGALGSGIRWRRTLAGALTALQNGVLTVETAPPRRSGYSGGGRNALTTAGGKRAKPAKSR
ncbi:MAG TPA: tRNA lysidine(34) synthetase TilS [Pseudolabrys sp.]|nr:tRNA lysidine(34) synthetase TilS [Pseudolabrys sp.]